MRRIDGGYQPKDSGKLGTPPNAVSSVQGPHYEKRKEVELLSTQERAELQLYRNSGLAPWQVRAMRETVREQKKILDRYQGDRVNADIRCGEVIAYLNHEIFPKMDYADYCAIFDRIVSITDWENEVYGGSNKKYMRKSRGAAAEPSSEPAAGLRREESTEERT